METKEHTLKVTIEIPVTEQDMDDIMCTALEGGINHWCDQVEILGECLGKSASEHISHGGTLKLYGAEEVNGESKWWLSQETFLKGLQMWLDDGVKLKMRDSGLDTSDIDAEDADCIIQYALFGELVFG